MRPLYIYFCTRNSFPGLTKITLFRGFKDPEEEMGAHPGVSSGELTAYNFEIEKKTVGKKCQNNTIHYSLKSQGHMEAIDKINLTLLLKYKYQLGRAVKWEEEVCLICPGL